MPEGIIFDIKKFAIHDGPGIRTTIFLKGCPLDCWWCHNPESKNPKIEYLDDKHGHTQEVGERKNVAEIVETVLKDEIFYQQSGGGVTLSGGEPFMQEEFSLALLKEFKSLGLHTAIDTCGYVSDKIMEQVLPFVDLFLYDVKSVDDKFYQKYTGVSIDPILENLDLLLKYEADLEIRIPLIPGITDTQKNLTDIRDYLIEKNIFEATLLPYNYFVEDKLKRFNYQNKIGSLQKHTERELDEICHSIEMDGFKFNFDE